MVQSVGDYRSNRNEHIVHAIDVLRKSVRRQKVFLEIYKGKKQFKTVEEIRKATGLSQVAVLQEGTKLFNEQIVERKKIEGKMAYGKVGVFTVNKPKIVSGLKKHASIIEKKYPTKQVPKVAASRTVIKLAQGLKVRASSIECDDVGEFAKVRKCSIGPRIRMSEARIKAGFAKLLSDKGVHKDWGGEKNDLLSKATVAGKKRRIAFAFKGPGTSGVLTPAKLGKNGDQIQRLFETAVEVFFIQYHGQIAESVLRQMQTFAEIKSIKDNTRVWYGIIDGDDTDRLVATYGSAYF
jgi:hypothetical protein